MFLRKNIIKKLGRHEMGNIFLLRQYQVSPSTRHTNGAP